MIPILISLAATCSLIYLNWNMSKQVEEACDNYEKVYDLATKLVNKNKQLQNQIKQLKHERRKNK